MAKKYAPTQWGKILADHGRIRMLKKTRAERRAEKLAEMEKELSTPKPATKPPKAIKRSKAIPAPKAVKQSPVKNTPAKKEAEKWPTAKKKSSWASKKNN